MLRRRYISSHYLADSSLSQDMIGSSFFGSKRDGGFDLLHSNTSDTEAPQFENVGTDQTATDQRVNDRKYKNSHILLNQRSYKG